MGYIRVVVGLAGLILLVFALRVDHLRADHLQTINDTAKVLKDAGLGGANRKNLAASTLTLVNSRDQARQERDTARQLVQTQGDSILALQKETEQYIDNAKAQQRMIEATTRQRDLWIKRARDAATRTERMSAEEEVKQCEQVLDALYSQGF